MEELVKIEKVSNELVVTSRTIANELEKRHDDVIRKIREVLTSREFSERKYTYGNNNKATEFLLDKDSFVLLVMNYQGYNEFKRAYIKRFNQMEKELKKQIAPTTMKEALQLALKQQEEIEELEKTKAYISNKKTATAMNTASRLSKENKKLKIKVGESKRYATITAVQSMTKGDISWRELKKCCNDLELDIKKVPDERYGEVNSYPAKAWKTVYGLDLSDLF